MSQGGLPILTYHAIDTTPSPISTDPVWFAETMARLHAEGYRTVDLEDWMADSRPSLERHFAITFDDGLASIGKVVDVLERYEFRATVFVVSGRVGRDNAWPGQPAGIPLARLLDWDELAALTRRGFAIGSHTCSHPVLNGIDDTGLERELRESREAIEDRLGVACRTLAYPYGIASRCVRRQAARVYGAALGTRVGFASHAEDPHDLSRLDAYEYRAESGLIALLSGRVSCAVVARRMVRAARKIRLILQTRAVSPPRELTNPNAARTHPTQPPLIKGGNVFRLPPLIRGGWGGCVQHSEKQAASARLALACPVCRKALADSLGTARCDHCRTNYPRVAGMVDLRLAGDRYLDLVNERAKATRLAELAEDGDLESLARAYYAMTPDVAPRRRERYVAHIRTAERRGEALAALLPRRGAVLEIGCGTGGLLVAAAARGLEIVGTDIALRWLVLAQRRLRDHALDVPLVAADGARLPWGDEAFEAVVADSVVEHIVDPRAALAEWRRVTRPGGQLVLWSPNRYSLAPDPHVGLSGLGWLPRSWTPGYVRLRRQCPWPIQPRGAVEMARLAKAAGWSEVHVEAPRLPSTMGATRAMRLALRAYKLSRANGLGHWGLIHLGPLWQLTARNGAAP